MNQTTRGLVILVARLTAKEHKRIFSLCHYFATSSHPNLSLGVPRCSDEYLFASQQKRGSVVGPVFEAAA
jgi:hypothetical protein